jgi:segregation and condensation protein B
LSPADRALAILFVADAPLSEREIAGAAQMETAEVAPALEEIRDWLGERAIRLVRLAGGWQLTTRPEAASMLAAFLRPSGTRLSRGLMETLAVVAYRQPAPAAEIEAERGVDCGHALRALVERRLVREAGRKLAPGRPILYATTDSFLHQFGLDRLEDLPPLEEPS